jgi:hypothetical protein
MLFVIEIYCTLYIYISCTKTSNKTVPLTNLNKYLHYDTSETEVNLTL